MAYSRKFLIAMVVFNGLLVAGNVAWWYNAAHQSVGSKAAHYPLLARRIFADNPSEILINFIPLRKQIEARLSEVKAPVSFYFEYLPDGTSVRLGEDTELIAASLIKLPLVMDLYRAEELGKIHLDDQTEVTAGDLDQGYGDLWRKGIGTKLTLREAAHLALNQSDNTAANVVYRSIKDLIPADQEALARLDIDYHSQDGVAVISAKSYSSILKCLYYSCYLNWTDSQDILDTLARSSFNDRLTKPIPADVKVAHKIGVYDGPLSESDCGIVYAPRHPYLLCIMTGLPEDQATGLMSELSKTIYDYVTK